VPSNALTVHLEQLLQDAVDIQEAHTRLWSADPGLRYRLAALNRAMVVSTVSAWESYVEELMRECLEALQPPAPPLDPWPALNAWIRGLVGRFHNPDSTNVTHLIDQSLGLQNVHLAWTWRNCTSTQAVRRLDDALNYRHQIAHGVNPRPGISNTYANSLPRFFRRLAGCTDRAVRHHLVTALGVANPWPP
jgi:hypothetical protein